MDAHYIRSTLQPLQPLLIWEPSAKDRKAHLRYVHGSREVARHSRMEFTLCYNLRRARVECRSLEHGNLVVELDVAGELFDRLALDCHLPALPMNVRRQRFELAGNLEPAADRPLEWV